MTAPGQSTAPGQAAKPGQVTVPGEEVGVASWYGHPYHGRRTANGELYDMDLLTAAHQTRPFNQWVRVENLQNGKTVDVRINDRGPFVDNRIIDLSRAAARSIEMIGPGTVLVRVETIYEPPAPADPFEASGEARVPPAATGYFGVQAGAFGNIDNAEQMADQMNQIYGAARLIIRDGDPPVWRVVVGEFEDRAEAEALAAAIRAETGAAFVTRLDDAGEQD